jgi:hypothetical protein
VPDVPSSRVASFIVDRLPFNRLYYYGRDRPLHVSIGPERCGAIIVVLAGASGRRVPRQMTRDRFLRFLRDGDLKI